MSTTLIPSVVIDTLAWIAAIALSMDVPLVTHNSAHYALVPLLRVITEADP